MTWGNSPFKSLFKNKLNGICSSDLNSRNKHYSRLRQTPKKLAYLLQKKTPETMDSKIKENQRRFWLEQFPVIVIFQGAKTAFS